MLEVQEFNKKMNEIKVSDSDLILMLHRVTDDVKYYNFAVANKKDFYFAIDKATSDAYLFVVGDENKHKLDEYHYIEAFTWLRTVSH